MKITRKFILDNLVNGIYDVISGKKNMIDVLKEKDDLSIKYMDLGSKRLLKDIDL